MSTVAADILVVLGAVFMAEAALGLVRFPDLFSRMHAASKATSLGMGLLLAGLAVASGRLEVALKALVVVVFIFLTMPVAAHLLGRAGYLGRADRGPVAKVDELHRCYTDSGLCPGLPAVLPGEGASKGEKRTLSGDPEATEGPERSGD